MNGRVTKLSIYQFKKYTFQSLFVLMCRSQAFLKAFVELDCLMFDGKEFQSSEPLTAKEFLRISSLACGTTSGMCEF